MDLVTKKSARKERVFEAFTAHVEKRGYPPSVRELCEQLDIPSTSTVQSHLRDLRKLKLIPNEHRLSMKPSMERLVKENAQLRREIEVLRGVQS